MSSSRSKIKDIIIYKTKDNNIELKVTLKKETVWLDQRSIAQLFGVKVPAISKHIKNIFNEGELQRSGTVSKMEIVQKEGKRKIQRIIDMYNLDMIISIGYRVNSKLATQFRIWSTNVLKNYLIEGYVINQKRLEEDSSKYKKLRIQISNLERVIDTQSLTSNQSQALLRVMTDYSKALELLDSVDKRLVPKPKTLTRKNVVNLSIKELRNDIDILRVQLKASTLFGQDNDMGLESVLKSINQSFDDKNVYPSVERKAANLLYLIIKNHPFVDGNKRIGAFTFLRYLSLNNLLYRKDGSRSVEQDTLVAIALLLAQSNSKDKDVMIDLVVYLISKD